MKEQPRTRNVQDQGNFLSRYLVEILFVLTIGAMWYTYSPYLWLVLITLLAFAIGWKVYPLHLFKGSSSARRERAVPSKPEHQKPAAPKPARKIAVAKKLKHLTKKAVEKGKKHAATIKKNGKALHKKIKHAHKAVRKAAKKIKKPAKPAKAPEKERPVKPIIVLPEAKPAPQKRVEKKPAVKRKPKKAKKKPAKKTTPKPKKKAVKKTAARKPKQHPAKKKAHKKPQKHLKKQSKRSLDVHPRKRIEKVKKAKAKPATHKAVKKQPKKRKRMHAAPVHKGHAPHKPVHERKPATIHKVKPKKAKVVRKPHKPVRTAHKAPVHKPKKPALNPKHTGKASLQQKVIMKELEKLEKRRQASRNKTIAPMLTEKIRKKKAELRSLSSGGSSKPRKEKDYSGREGSLELLSDIFATEKRKVTLEKKRRKR